MDLHIPIKSNIIIHLENRSEHLHTITLLNCTLLNNKKLEQANSDLCYFKTAVKGNKFHKQRTALSVLEQAPNNLAEKIILKIGLDVATAL